MALGRYDLSLLTLPVGWDATALENERLVDGTTYAEVAQMVNTAIASLNAELRGDLRIAAREQFHGPSLRGPRLRSRRG